MQLIPRFVEMKIAAENAVLREKSNGGAIKIPPVFSGGLAAAKFNAAW